jgi:uncharacterized small protein (DUF1192 family)
VVSLKKLFQRDTGPSDEERQQVEAALRAAELPSASAALKERVASVLRVQGDVSVSSRALLNGETDEPEGHTAAFLQRLGRVEDVVSGLSAHLVEDASQVESPSTVIQQLQYLAEELGVLEADLSLVGGSIGGFRRRIATLTQQVETTRQSLSAKESSRHALQNGRAASNAVLREREKKVEALNRQIGTTAPKLQRKERQLGEMEQTDLPDIQVEEGNGHAGERVGALMATIEERLSRIDPARAPVGDPQTQFPEVFERVHANGNGKVQDNSKPDPTVLRGNVQVTNEKLDHCIAPTVVVFERALNEAIESVLEDLNGGTLSSSDFLRALNKRYNELLKEEGMGTMRGRLKNSSEFLNALPKDFGPSMDCIEALQAEWERKKEVAEQGIAKMEQRFNDEWKSASRGRTQVIPQIRKRHTRRGMEASAPPQSPLFNSRYKREQGKREEARLKLEYIKGARQGTNLSSPIKAAVRWFKQKAEAKVQQIERQQQPQKKKRK